MKKSTVLVLTNSREFSSTAICEYLDSFGCDFLRVDTDLLCFPKNNLTISFDSGFQNGHLCFGGKKVFFDEISSVLYRHPLWKQTKTKDEYDFIEKEVRSAFWSVFSDLDVFWVNNPWVATRFLENNKLYQMKIASSVGLLTPKTIISNNVSDLLSFCCDFDDKVIIKPIHSQIIKDDKGTVFGVFAQPISHSTIEDFKAGFEVSPVMVQEYVEKMLELRVTVVGEKIFTCAIHSQDSNRTKHDWRRYDFKNVKHTVYALPSDIESMILRFVSKIGLEYAAIDMVITPNKDYVFLEVNPSGQYGWIEKLTGMPISKTIAELLRDNS